MRSDLIFAAVHAGIGLVPRTGFSLFSLKGNIMSKMTIDLENTDIGDLFVSVWDLNMAGKPNILNKERINKDDKFPIDVEVDGSQYYSIRWYAVSPDDPTKNKTENVRDNTRDTVDISTYMS